MYIYIYNVFTHTHIYIYIHIPILNGYDHEYKQHNLPYQWYRTRRWRKFQNRKPIGEFGCCESRMAERIH